MSWALACLLSCDQLSCSPTTPIYVHSILAFTSVTRSQVNKRSARPHRALRSARPIKVAILKARMVRWGASKRCRGSAWSFLKTSYACGQSGLPLMWSERSPADIRVMSGRPLIYVLASVAILCPICIYIRILAQDPISGFSSSPCHGALIIQRSQQSRSP